MNEKQYDNIYNEGVEGYNPYRDTIDTNPKPQIDRDIAKLAEARQELWEMAGIFARGIITGQGLIAVSEAKDIITSITNRRPELIDDTDTTLFESTKVDYKQ